MKEETALEIMRLAVELAATAMPLVAGNTIKSSSILNPNQAPTMEQILQDCRRAVEDGMTALLANP